MSSRTKTILGRSAVAIVVAAPDRRRRRRAAESVRCSSRSARPRGADRLGRILHRTIRECVHRGSRATSCSRPRPGRTWCASTTGSTPRQADDRHGALGRGREVVLSGRRLRRLRGLRAAQAPHADAGRLAARGAAHHRGARQATATATPCSRSRPTRATSSSTTRTRTSCCGRTPATASSSASRRPIRTSGCRSAIRGRPVTATVALRQRTGATRPRSRPHPSPSPGSAAQRFLLCFRAADHKRCNAMGSADGKPLMAC